MLTRLNQVIRNNMQQTASSAVRSFQLGQIFKGKVEKLFPNQLAIVQAGNQKLVAQLQVGLALGEHYWFQVESLEGRPQLKVLQMQKGSNQDETSTMTNLLRQMNLPSAKNNIELLQFFMKEGIPLTKGLFKQAAEILADFDLSQESLRTLKEIIHRNLPLTKDVFVGIHSVIKNEPLHQLMTNLYNLLTVGPVSSTGEQLSALLRPMLQSQEQKVTENVVSQLFSLWLNPNEKENSRLAFTILQRLGILPNGDETTQLQQALKNETIAGFRADFSGQEEQNNQIKQYLLAGLRSSNQANANSPQQILSLFAHNNSLPSILNPDGSVKIQGEWPEAEQQLLQKVTNEALNELPALTKGKEVANLLKNLYDLFGFRYEKDLLEGNVTNQKNTEILKSLLMQLGKEDVSQAIKEAGQGLLNRMIGLQLISQDSSSLLQQYVMQIPISLWDKTADLTIQWQGRKKDNGEIDPNYCRVLFYLDMDVLKETIVDMQVQNRVLRLVIFNDTEGIHALSKTLENKLREQLQNLGYTLSTISFTSTNSRENSPTKTNYKTVLPNGSYSGVDIRI